MLEVRGAGLPALYSVDGSSCRKSGPLVVSLVLLLMWVFFAEKVNLCNRHAFTKQIRYTFAGSGFQ